MQKSSRPAHVVSFRPAAANQEGNIGGFHVFANLTYEEHTVSLQKAIDILRAKIERDIFEGSYPEMVEVSWDDTKSESAQINLSGMWVLHYVSFVNVTSAE